MSSFGWNFVFVGKHRNQSILRPKKCISLWPVLWVDSEELSSSWRCWCKQGPNRTCIRTSRPLIFHVTSWASSVGVLVFLKINFPLKISPMNHIYLREEKQAHVCFLYIITLWGSCHENIYIFKFSYFPLFIILILVLIRLIVEAKRIQILLWKLRGTISDIRLPIT